MSGSASERPASADMKPTGPKQPAGPPPRHVLKAQMDKAAEAASTLAEIKRFERANNLQPSTVHALEQLPLELRKKIMSDIGFDSSDTVVYAQIKVYQGETRQLEDVVLGYVGTAGPGSAASLAIGPGTAGPQKALSAVEIAEQALERRALESLPVQSTTSTGETGSTKSPTEKAGMWAGCVRTASNGRTHSATSKPEDWKSTISMLSGQGSENTKKADGPSREPKATASTRTFADPLRPLLPHESREDSQAGYPHPGYQQWMAWHTWQMMAAARSYPGFMPGMMQRDGSGREKKEKKEKKDGKEKKDKRDKNDDKEKPSRGGGTGKRACGTSRDRSRKRQRHRDLSPSSSAGSSSSLARGGRAGRPVPVNAAPVPKAKASAAPSDLTARVKDLASKLSVQQVQNPQMSSPPIVAASKFKSRPPARRSSVESSADAKSSHEVPLMASTPLAGCLVSTPLAGCLAQAGDALIGQTQVAEAELQRIDPSQEEAITHGERPAVQSQEASEAAPGLSAEQKLHDWLLNLDGGRGSLLQFFDVLRSEFDADFNQIGAVRLPEPNEGVLGAIDPSFWEVCGIERMGHRLLLARGISMLPDPKN